MCGEAWLLSCAWLDSCVALQRGLSQGPTLHWDRDGRSCQVGGSCLGAVRAYTHTHRHTNNRWCPCASVERRLWEPGFDPLLNPTDRLKCSRVS